MTIIQISVLLNFGTICQEYVVFQGGWSLKAGFTVPPYRMPVAVSDSLSSNMRRVIITLIGSKGGHACYTVQ